MSLIANQVVLSELSKALDVLELPHDKLPEVKNKDGEVITDAKDKRLALVKQHIANVGQIIDTADQAEQMSEQIIGQTLQMYHSAAVRDVIQRITGGRVKGLPGAAPPSGPAGSLADLFGDGNGEAPDTYPDGSPRRMGFVVPTGK